METVELDVDSNSPTEAGRIYTSFGFVTVRTIAIYQKTENTQPTYTWNSGNGQWFDCGKLLNKAILCKVKIVLNLEVKPKLRRGSKVLGKPQCRISRNPTFAMHDLIDSARRNPN